MGTLFYSWNISNVCVCVCLHTQTHIATLNKSKPCQTTSPTVTTGYTIPIHANEFTTQNPIDFMDVE